MADKAKQAVLVDEKELPRVKVLVGFNYPGVRGEKRANEGDLVLVAELPPTSVGWLLREHVIELYEPPVAGEDSDKDASKGGDS